MTYVAIIDCDGTLSDTSARKHHLEQKPKNWKAWNDSMHLDEPRPPIVELAKLIWRSHQIVICTGREESYRDTTEAWLKKHEIPFDRMYMRATGDYRADDVIKSEMLVQMRADGYEPWVVIDDRDRVVEMFRNAGLTVLQCAKGDF